MHLKSSYFFSGWISFSYFAGQFVSFGEAYYLVRKIKEKVSHSHRENMKT
jgi:hypothetical protein